MKRKEVIPKHLIRYADDWIINLSKEKTIITDLRKKRAKFLGYKIEASTQRGSPGKQRRTRVVGKFYPDKKMAKKKVIEIGKEIRQLR